MANPIWSSGCKNLTGFLLALAVFVTVQGCSNSQLQSSVPAVLPTIHSFSASSATVPAGGTTTLSWATQNADRLMLYPSNQDVTSLSSLQVSVSATTTFTLKASNAKGEAAANTVVNTVAADTSGSVQLVYTDPPAGGKIRLVKDAESSTANGVALKLVANSNLTGYYVGFNLPVASGKVQFASPSISPANDALNPGTAPQAMGAKIPSSGPLANVLVTGLSQKAAGAGAAANNARISSGQVFYTIHLRPADGATPGVVFSGTALGSQFRAALRDRLGNEIASQSDFAIGTLAVQLQ